MALSSLVLGPSAAERTSDLFVNWTKHTSTYAEPSLYTKTMQNCFLFLAILCNKSTNHLLPILVVVYLKMSCSFLLALSFDESTIYCVLSELYPKVNISYTHT